MNNLGMLYVARGDYRKAEPLYLKSIEINSRLFSPKHPDNLKTMGNLADLYRGSKQYEKAETLFEKVLEADRRVFGPDHVSTQRVMANLSKLYKERDQFEKLEPLLVELLASKKRTTGVSILEIKDLTMSLVLCRFGRRKFAEAEPILRECIADDEKRLPDSWALFHTRSLLGESLLGQEKYAEAEPLLVSAYEGIRDRQSMIPPQFASLIADAGGRVIRLYEGWGKAEDAARWQAKLKAEDDAYRAGQPPKRPSPDPSSR